MAEAFEEATSFRTEGEWSGKGSSGTLEGAIGHGDTLTECSDDWCVDEFSGWLAAVE